MNKVLLKKINLEWTVSELIEEVRSLKKLEPNCFICGDSKSIAVIK